jgi:subtilisin-like proprotein convertase family protein
MKNLNCSKMMAGMLALCAGTVMAQPTVTEDFGPLVSTTTLNRTVAVSGTSLTWYKFSIGALPTSGNGFLDIWTATFSGSAVGDTEIGVYNSLGGVVAFDDDSDSGNFSNLTFGSTTVAARPANAGGTIFGGRNGALAAGDYYLVVGNWNMTFGATNWSITGLTGTAVGNTNLNVRYTASDSPSDPSCVISASPSTVGNQTGESVSFVVNVTPGTLPASTAHTVTMDTSALGDASPQPVTFVEGPANVFTYNVQVTNAVAGGTYALTANVQETAPNSRTGSCNVSVTVREPSNPTCTLVASPEAIDAAIGGSVTLTTNVVPGQFPASAAHTVTADTSSLGDTAPQPVTFTEDAPNQFSYTFTVPANSATGSYSITSNVTEVGGLGRTTTCEEIIRLAAIPANDLFENAVELSSGSSEAGSTLDATIDTGNPICNGQTISSGGVWYFTQGTGNTMVATLCNGPRAYDSRMTVYCLSNGALSCVGGNDDFCGLSSQVSFCTQEGATYYILVHGFSAGRGDFQIDLTDDSVPCTTAVLCLPTGACCLPDSCSIVTADACAGQGGVYNGDGTTCSTTTITDSFTSDQSQYPLAITDLSTVTATMEIPAGSGVIDGLGVKVTLDHTFWGDLIGTLSNGSSSVILFNRGGLGSDAAGSYVFTDTAATTIAGATAVGGAIPAGEYLPVDALSTLNGLDYAGTWTLTIQDAANLDVGQLNDFAFSIVTVTSNCAAGCGCAADYNADGGVDGADVEAFFTDWAGATGCSDVNVDGGVDGADVESFFAVWAAGGC